LAAFRFGGSTMRGFRRLLRQSEQVSPHESAVMPPDFVCRTGNAYLTCAPQELNDPREGELAIGGDEEGG
jgi:hypothetical protein